MGEHRVALIVQIHLLQNRPDLAAKEAQNARKWAQDSLLVNLAEAWVGLRRVCAGLPPPLIYQRLLRPPLPTTAHHTAPHTVSKHYLPPR